MVVLEYHPDVGLQRPAHDQPHDGFDTLGARASHDLGVGELSHPLRIVRDLIHTLQVEFDIDQAGAFTLQLVR